MTVSVWQADGSQPIREVDFLVIGAGLVGCAAAHFAASAGKKVVIVDSREVGLGASSRNAGFMLTGLDSYYHRAIEEYGHAVTHEMWRLSLRTHAYWRDIIQKHRVPMISCGSMLLAETPEEAKDLETATRAMESDGLPAEYLPHDPLGRGYYAAIRQAHDAAVQPYLLTRAVFAESGADLVANNEVYAIRPFDAQTVEVETRLFRFRAAYVMICTNAYSAQIHPYFKGKVIPTRAQCLVTDPLPNSPILGTCGYSDYGFMYYRDTFDGRLLIGGGRKQNKPAEHDTMDDRVTDGVQRILDQYLVDRFPELLDVRVSRRWSGIMGFTPDGLPLVGTLPDLPRVGFAVGFNGHGLALGAGTAERAVEMLLAGRDPGAVSCLRAGIA
jgi:glycine/D-amino acid oxidase-like deaminating enzyme